MNGSPDTPHGLFVVGIAASAGGLPAISDLLQHASCHKSMCFVVVSHLDRFRKSDLVRILCRASKLETHEIENDMALQHCHVYVIPPNQYAKVRDGRFVLSPRPTKEPNQVGNVFFESLAREYRTNAIGVVLSGAKVGADGASGITQIKEVGGHTFAQDPLTALYPDMPQASIATGDVKMTGSPQMIGHELSLISWVAEHFDASLN